MIPESELILNPRGSVYHLDLLPNEIAKTIITVGDPDRALMISEYFDTILFKQKKREFHTYTGILNGKELTVISTGIGTDNIDIVLQELDALVNIDLKTRTIKEKKTSLKFFRIGTSGAFQDHIKPDQFLISEMAVGLDGLMLQYDYEKSEQEKSLEKHIKQEIHLPLNIYAAEGSSKLLEAFKSPIFTSGITLTAGGFYGPQGRTLRLKPKQKSLIQDFKNANWEGKIFTNFEMETAGIYGLAKALGHHAISINAILANRSLGVFSTKPSETVKELVETCLPLIVEISNS